MRTLILGGARSGKSRLAEARAQASGREVVYVATAAADDPEMRERIARHRSRRPPQWITVVEPLALGPTLAASAGAERLVIVDCLTLWLANLLAEGEARLAEERESLLHTLPRLPGEVLLVANETGLGIVPDNALARRFRDEAGWLHQELAQRVERVVFTVAGLPHFLKGEAWT